MPAVLAVSLGRSEVVDHDHRRSTLDASAMTQTGADDAELAGIDAQRALVGVEEESGRQHNASSLSA